MTARKFYIETEWLGVGRWRWAANETVTYARRPTDDDPDTTFNMPLVVRRGRAFTERAALRKARRAVAFELKRSARHKIEEVQP